MEIDSCVNHIECMILELKIEKQSCYVIMAYKNPKVPNNMFINKLKGVYESVIHKTHDIILLGDLNIDMLKEDNELQNELCHICDLDKPHF